MRKPWALPHWLHAFFTKPPIHARALDTQQQRLPVWTLSQVSCVPPQPRHTNGVDEVLGLTHIAVEVIPRARRLTHVLHLLGWGARRNQQRLPGIASLPASKCTDTRITLQTKSSLADA
jgi:hypothetical protein